MGLAEVAARERPDVIVAQGGSRNAYEIAAHSHRMGYKTFSTPTTSASSCDVNRCPTWKA